MLKGMDIEGMMKNIDMGAMGSLMKNVDIGAIMKNMDMGAMTSMMKNVDINGLMKNIDMGAMTDIMKNVDIGSIMKNVDMGSIMKKFDLGSITGLLKNIDIGSLLKSAGPMMAAMKGLNLGPVAGTPPYILPISLIHNMFVVKSNSIWAFITFKISSIMMVLDNLLMRHLGFKIMGYYKQQFHALCTVSTVRILHMHCLFLADIMSTIAPMTDMLRGFDIKGVIDMVKEKPIDLERLINLKDAAWDFLEQKGVPSKQNFLNVY